MKKCYWIFCLFAIVLMGCSGGGDGNGGNDYNPNSGKDNTTDVVVTGGVQQVGMTYADVLGYQNAWDISQMDDIAAGGFIGVEYGTSQNALNKTARYSSSSGREIYTTIRGLLPNTKYYYRALVGAGSNYVRGSEILSFTTKEAAFTGRMTTGQAEDITFKHATISSDINTSSLNAKEVFHKGLVFSQNTSDLTVPLANKLYQASRVTDNIGGVEIIYIDQGNSDIPYYAGHYQNGSVHFQMGGDEGNSQTLTVEPGTTIYYCPVLIIGDKSFTGDIKQVTTRDLAVKSGYVDLGLSCLWAATNLEASSPWERGWSGSRRSAASSEVESKGNGGRLPTIEEVMELNSCKMENMDGGLLITGPNGNQIFLTDTESSYGWPGSSTNYDGYYWTSSSTASTTLGSTTWYDQLFYVGSGKVGTFDRPDLSYPYNMNYSNCYVRAVKDGGSGTGTGNEFDASTIAGTYTTKEYQYYGDEGKWYYMTPDYEMTITTNSYNPIYVEIYNLWQGGKTITGELNSQTGDITISSGQSIYDHSTYGNVWVEPYEDKITFTYDAATRTYSSNIMSPVCSEGHFRYFWVELVHQ